MKRVLCVILSLAMVMTAPAMNVFASVSENGFEEEADNLILDEEIEVTAGVDDSADEDVAAAPLRTYEKNAIVEPLDRPDVDLVRASGDKSVKKPGQKTIAAKYKSFYSAYDSLSEDIFAEEPSVVSPFSTGELKSSYLDNAATYLNFVRYIAGLPDVSLNSELNKSAQYGAVIAAANGKTNHAPTKLAGMTDAFYNKAYDASAWSNLYGYATRSTNPLLVRSIIAYMNDNTKANLPGMGHRRWVLLPELTRTGFGQAISSNDKYTAGVMRVTKGQHDTVDPESPRDMDYDFISWPASGNFPLDNEHLNLNIAGTRVPWTVTLNPGKYTIPTASSLKISVTRESDGKEWSFDANDVNASPFTSSEKYMYVSTKGYGIANAIIFNLGKEYTEDTYLNGAKEQLYTVRIDGLKTKTGISTSLLYKINFFDVNNPDESSSYYESGEGLSSGSSGGGGGDDEDDDEPDTPISENVKMYTLKFDGAHPDTMTVEEGNCITRMPAYDDEIPEGYYFVGWYIKEGDSLTEVFSENTRVYSDLYLYPKFEERNEEAVSFEDEGDRPVITLSDTSFVYSGEANKPEVTVTCNGKSLVENVDYRLYYTDNINAGTGCVAVTGIGDYTGTAKKEFTIGKRNISNAEIWVEDLTNLSDGDEFYPSSLNVHAIDMGSSLTNSIDYNVDVRTAVVTLRNGAGTCKLDIVGTGNYSGKKAVSFKCYSASKQVQTIYDSIKSAGAANLIKKSGAAYDSSRGCFVYTGSGIKPDVSIPGLTKGRDYKVSYKNNKNVGMATVIITGKKAYKGTYKLFFTIGARDISDATVSTIKDMTFTGSQLKPKPVATVLVDLGNGRTKKLKVKIGRGATAEYANNINVSGEEKASVTLTGYGNFKGSVTGYFNIIPAKMSKTSISSLSYSFDEDTLTKDPVVKLKSFVVSSDDYLISDVIPDEATGKVTVIFSGRGNLTGDKTVKFKGN